MNLDDTLKWHVADMKVREGNKIRQAEDANLEASVIQLERMKLEAAIAKSNTAPQVEQSPHN